MQSRDVVFGIEICYRNEVRRAENEDPGDVAMDRYACGDRAAFGEVYDAVAPRVLSYLRRQTRSLELAEDLLQQTFLQMHRGSSNFVAGSAVIPWAFAIARHLLVDERRRQKRNVLSGANEVATETIAGGPHLAPEGFVVAKELARQFQGVLEQLPASQREAFELMRLDGLSYAEAAKVLGITESAVKFRAYRAHAALKAITTEPDSGELP
jgi:RNA polymerase sigma-70 factor (ECF subfamily)